MKKGFTLIELLGVIIVLILIFLIVVPKVVNSVNTKKTELIEVNDDVVLSAAKLYVSSHEDKFESENNSVGWVKIMMNLILNMNMLK